MLRVQKLFAVALAAGAAATVPAVSQASTDRNSCLSQGQGVNHYALVRERARLRARPPVIGCVPAGVKVLGARIDWGDGTSTPVAVEERAQAAQIVLPTSATARPSNRNPSTSRFSPRRTACRSARSARPAISSRSPRGWSAAASAAAPS
jgi:hypothetical protein